MSIYSDNRHFTERNDNTLDDNEKEQCFKSLFDGSSLNGWRTYLGKPGSWVVENGTFYCHKVEAGIYADLITNDKYENFELHIDWKMQPRANSGIMYMVTEQYEHSYESGPEYQLLDDASYKTQIKPDQHTAAAYAMKAPTLLDLNKPVGEWNHTIIIVNKGHVEHWLNGIQVVQYELWSEEWKASKANSKWKDVEGYGMSKTGHICLQDYHGEGNVWFKNVKLRTFAA